MKKHDTKFASEILSSSHGFTVIRYVFSPRGTGVEMGSTEEHYALLMSDSAEPVVSLKETNSQGYFSYTLEVSGGAIILTDGIEVRNQIGLREGFGFDDYVVDGVLDLGECSLFFQRILIAGGFREHIPLEKVADFMRFLLD